VLSRCLNSQRAPHAGSHVSLFFGFIIEGRAVRLVWLGYQTAKKCGCTTAPMPPNHWLALLILHVSIVASYLSRKIPSVQ